MHTIISPAKTFVKKDRELFPRDKMTSLLCPEEVDRLIKAISQLEEAYLLKSLKVSAKMKPQVLRLWQELFLGTSPLMPSLEAYDGMVFKKADVRGMSEDDWAFAQDQLSICSFLYGLLRPTDGISPYRLEGAVKLTSEEVRNVFAYHQSYLTDVLIQRTLESGDNTLIFLASEEMKQLFDWERVEQELRVINMEFLTRRADGSLGQVTVYTKMARGATLGAILRQRITEPEVLKTLQPEGFVFDEASSSSGNFVYILEQL